MNKNLRSRLIINFFQTIASTAFFPFIAIFLSDKISIYTTGVFLTVTAISNIPTSIIGGYLIENFSKKKNYTYLSIYNGYFFIYNGYFFNIFY